MADKLKPRNARIVAAGKLIAGGRWQSALSRTTGLSKQLLSFIAAGEREVTNDVYRKIAMALLKEADRERAAAGKIDDIAGKMLAELDG